jgi:hypothetical protein
MVIWLYDRAIWLYENECISHHSNDSNDLFELMIEDNENKNKEARLSPYSKEQCCIVCIFCTTF